MLPCEGATVGGHCDIVKLHFELYPVVSRANGAMDVALSMALVDTAFYGHMDILMCLVDRGIIPTKQAIMRRSGATTTSFSDT